MFWKICVLSVKSKEKKRVWSWLRMNAGGRHNTCKSNAIFFVKSSGERVSNTWEFTSQFRESEELGVIYNCIKNSFLLRESWILHYAKKGKTAERWARGGLGSWRGKGPPSPRSLVDSREWSTTLGLRNGPDTFGRQQWGILDNGRKLDPAMHHRGGRLYRS